MIKVETNEQLKELFDKWESLGTKTIQIGTSEHQIGDGHPFSMIVADFPFEEACQSWKGNNGCYAIYFDHTLMILERDVWYEGKYLTIYQRQ